MKLIKTILGWRPVWLTLLFGVLVMLVRWVAPVLMANASDDVVQPVVIGLQAALGLLWLVSILWVTISYLRLNGLRLPPLPSFSSPEVRREDEAAREAVATAQAALARLPDGDRLPWLAVLGARGVGKSTALVRGGGACNRLDAGGLPYRPEPDERCAVVRCGGAVYIDTSGRWVEEDSGREGWRKLLAALRLRRPEQPLDGLVVVVDVGDLIVRGPAEGALLADRLRARLDDAVEILGVAPPFHLVITHAERVAGFCDTFQDLPTPVAGRPWGSALELGQTSATDAPGAVRKVIQDLAGRLERWTPAVLVRVGGERLGPALLFPAQLRTLEAPLMELVRRLTAPSVTERCSIAGLWLTGVTSAAQEVDRLGGGLGSLGEVLRAPRSSAPRRDDGRRGPERPMFLDGLFERVLPATRDHGGITAREQDRRRAVEWLRLKRLVAAFAMFAVSAATVGVLNLLYQRALERRLGEVLEELRSPSELGGPSAALSARLALFGAWGAPSWVLPDAGAVVERAGLDGDATPPSRLSALWLWPTHWIVGDDARRWTSRTAEDRLVRAASKLIHADLKGLSGPIPGVSGPLRGETPAEQDWMICGWSRTQLVRRWAEIYQPGEDGRARCEDGVLDEGEKELAEALAQRIAAGLPQQQEVNWCPAASDEQAGRVATDAWLLQRLFQDPQGRCDALAALVPGEGEMSAITARLQTIDPHEAAFAMLLQRVSNNVEQRLKLEDAATSLRPKSTLLRVSAGLRAAPAGYSLDDCQQFQLQLYALENSDIVNKSKSTLITGWNGGLEGIARNEIPELIGWEDMTELGLPVGTGAEKTKVIEQLTRLYQQRYAERWQRQWFSRIGVQDALLPELKTMGLNEIAEELRLAYGVGGDLERVLKLAGQGRLTPLEESEAETRPAWQKANKTCNALASTWSAGHAMVLGGDEGATAAFNAQRDAMLKLADVLQEVSSDGTKQAELASKTWAGEGDLRAAYLTTQSVAEKLRALTLRSTGAALEPAERARSEVGLLVSALGNTALHMTWARLLGAYEAQLEADWKAAVYDAWMEQSGRFPINPRAGQDVDPAALNEILGCDKLADGFIKDRLGPWVSLETGKLLSPEPLGPSAPTLRPSGGLRSFVEGRRSRCQVLTALQSELQFSVAPVRDRTSQLVTESRFIVNGQELIYQRYSQDPMKFVALPFAPARMVASVQQRQDLICADSSPDGVQTTVVPSVLRVIGARADANNVIVVSGSLGGTPCVAAWRLLETPGSGPAWLYRNLKALGLPLDLFSN
jgi:type VI protein secretion system component VasK